MLLESLPLELVLALTSQFVMVAPTDKFKEPFEVPELEPLRSIYLRFMPKELLARENAYVAFGDADGKQTVTWWTGPSAAPDSDSITYSLRQNILDSKVSLADNVSAHTKAADELIEKYNSGFLALILKT